MNFCTIRDLRTNSKELWGTEDVVITNNGKPKAVLIKTSDKDFIETLSMISSAKAIQAVNNIRSNSKKNGYFTNDEIYKEIKAVRKAK